MAEVTTVGRSLIGLSEIEGLNNPIRRRKADRRGKVFICEKKLSAKSNPSALCLPGKARREAEEGETTELYFFG